MAEKPQRAFDGEIEEDSVKVTVAPEEQRKGEGNINPLGERVDIQSSTFDTASILAQRKKNSLPTPESERQDRIALIREALNSSTIDSEKKEAISALIEEDPKLAQRIFGSNPGLVATDKGFSLMNEALLENREAEGGERVRHIEKRSSMLTGSPEAAGVAREEVVTQPDDGARFIEEESPETSVDTNEETAAQPDEAVPLTPDEHQETSTPERPKNSRILSQIRKNEQAAAERLAQLDTIDGPLTMWEKEEHQKLKHRYHVLREAANSYEAIEKGHGRLVEQEQALNSKIFNDIGLRLEVEEKKRGLAQRAKEMLDWYAKIPFRNKLIVGLSFTALSSWGAVPGGFAALAKIVGVTGLAIQRSLASVGLAVTVEGALAGSYEEKGIERTTWQKVRHMTLAGVSGLIAGGAISSIMESVGNSYETIKEVVSAAFTPDSAELTSNVVSGITPTDAAEALIAHPEGLPEYTSSRPNIMPGESANFHGNDYASAMRGDGIVSPNIEPEVPTETTDISSAPRPEYTPARPDIMPGESANFHGNDYASAMRGDGIVSPNIEPSEAAGEAAAAGTKNATSLFEWLGLEVAGEQIFKPEDLIHEVGPRDTFWGLLDKTFEPLMHNADGSAFDNVQKTRFTAVLEDLVQRLPTEELKEIVPSGDINLLRHNMPGGEQVNLSSIINKGFWEKALLSAQSLSESQYNSIATNLGTGIEHMQAAAVEPEVWQKI